MTFGRTVSLFGSLALLLVIPAFVGCFGSGGEEPAPEKDPAEETASAEPLAVAVVGSQQTADVLQREWSARSESPLSVRVATPEEAVNDARLNSDLVLFPASMLGELAAAEALLPLDDRLRNRDAFEQNDLLPLARQYDGRWGSEIVALPLGSALPVLVYRADVLEQAGLEPPKTWEEYGATLTKLRELQEAGELPEDVKAVVLEPTEATDAARHLLMRAAAYARVPGRYSGLFEFSSMKPELTSEAFVRALAEYRQVLGEGPIDATVTYADASRDLLSGNTAIGVTFLLEAPSLESEESLTRASQVAIAPVPGSTDYWQPRNESWERRESAESVPAWGDFGMLIGVGRSVADRERTLRALEAIVGAEIGTPVSNSADGTAPYRRSQLSSVARWTDLPATLGANAQYAEALSEMQSSSDHLLFPRIPSRERYLKALGEQVFQALEGKKTSAEALTDAAAEWDKITDELGREAQIGAYRASLGVAD